MQLEVRSACRACGQPAMGSCTSCLSCASTDPARPRLAPAVVILPAAASEAEIDHSAITSAVSPGLFLSVLARLAENGYAREVVRCVNICKDARSNAQLWERIVDLSHRKRAPNVFNTSPRFQGRAYTTRTRLMHWSGKGDLVRVLETLSRGANVNVREPSGMTALGRAIGRGHLAVTRELLARGADLHVRNADGLTALCVASSSGHADIVSELAARGADVNAVSSRGLPPLMCASCNGHAVAAAELLRLGADVNAQEDGCGRSALMLAAISGHADTVRVLLASPRIDVNLVDVRTVPHVTALSGARAHRHTAVAALLEAAGAH